MTIRLLQPGDYDSLLALAASTGVFQAHELDTLAEVLTDYHAVCQAEYGHQAWTLVDSGQPIGFVYLAPTVMTDQTWELWWIAVSKLQQGRGLGRRLLKHAEQAAHAAGARLLVIETSSLPHYRPTCLFYQQNGYSQVAAIPDFYADGDNKLIFFKRLRAKSSVNNSPIMKE